MSTDPLLQYRNRRITKRGEADGAVLKVARIESTGALTGTSATLTGALTSATGTFSGSVSGTDVKLSGGVQPYSSSDAYRYIRDWSVFENTNDLEHPSPNITSTPKVIDQVTKTYTIATGDVVMVRAHLQLTDTAATVLDSVTLELFRGVTAVKSWIVSLLRGSGTEYGLLSFTDYIDIPSTGAHTYTFKIYSNTTSTGLKCQCESQITLAHIYAPQLTKTTESWTLT